MNRWNESISLLSTAIISIIFKFTGCINSLLELFVEITNKLLFEGAKWEEPPLAKLLDLCLIVLLRFECLSDRASKKLHIVL
jgi:hypothetical protein